MKGKKKNVALFSERGISYVWNHKKKRNAIEVRVEHKKKKSFILINAETKEITFFGEIEWHVSRIDTSRNGWKTIHLFDEESLAKSVAKSL